MIKYLLPLILFIALTVFLALGLKLNPKDIPSPLIDKATPSFSLPILGAETEKLGPADYKGQVWLLNVWASWCVSCRDEHPILMQLAQKKLLPIVGLNYKDEAAAGLHWLEKHGNPYQVSIMDADGRVGIDYGVYGVPETFIIDKHGVIRYKHTGPISPDDIEQIFLPKIQQYQAEAL